MIKPFIALALSCCAAAAAPAAASEKPNEARTLMRQVGGGGLEGAKLAKAIAKAAKKPLGSRANPVRENMPQGQVAYLKRLRCAGGAAPAYDRQGNVGTGVFGNIVDHFRVTCPGAAPIDVFMDMYHDGPETRAIPGFTVAAETVPQS